MTPTLTLLQGDALAMLKTLPDESVQMCVTSPPYWGLRDYGVAGQLGLERTPGEYIARMVEVFREVRRVLRSDGTCWVNMGDSYCGSPTGKQSNNAYVSEEIGDGAFARRVARMQTGDGIGPMNAIKSYGGLKPKDLCGIPWRLAFDLQADGWWLRQDIIWAKPNPMPESVTDRCTKAHEYLFLLTKSARYYFDAEAIKEPYTESSIERYQYSALSKSGKTSCPEYRINGSQSSNALGVGRSTAALKSHEHELKQNGRNKRSVWTVATESYPESHFATYPTDLIKPCILAGTSARGCCPKCGSPWERVVEDYGRVKMAGGTTHDKVLSNGHGNGYNSMLRDGMVTQTKTTGWQETCDCRELGKEIADLAGQPASPSSFGPIPCTVLDPFAGSGTTGQVSLELGRSAILIELNPKYVALAERRCHITPGLGLA